MNLMIKTLFTFFVLLPFLASADTLFVVDAGPNEVVVYPASESATLSGSVSDIAGPVTFLWKQISGVSEAEIGSPTAAVTTINKLSPGIYTFSFTVTDSNGVSQSDTTSVSVFQKMTWVVEGVAREALVHPPLIRNDSIAPPVVIAYHGHGETDSDYAARGFELSCPRQL